MRIQNATRRHGPDWMAGEFVRHGLCGFHFGPGEMNAAIVLLCSSLPCFFFFFFFFPLSLVLCLCTGSIIRVQRPTLINVANSLEARFCLSRQEY